VPGAWHLTFPVPGWTAWMTAPAGAPTDRRDLIEPLTPSVTDKAHIIREGGNPCEPWGFRGALAPWHWGAATILLFTLSA
jgi:hypothetical protein